MYWKEEERNKESKEKIMKALNFKRGKKKKETPPLGNIIKEASFFKNFFIKHIIKKMISSKYT